MNPGTVTASRAARRRPNEPVHLPPETRSQHDRRHPYSRRWPSGRTLRHVRSIARKSVHDRNLILGVSELFPGSVPMLAGTLEVAQRCLAEAGTIPADVAAIGIANPRATAVVWERASGKPIYPAIVSRTIERVNELSTQGDVRHHDDGFDQTRVDPKPCRRRPARRGGRGLLLRHGRHMAGRAPLRRRPALHRQLERHVGAVAARRARDSRDTRGIGGRRGRWRTLSPTEPSRTRSPRPSLSAARGPRTNRAGRCRDLVRRRDFAGALRTCRVRVELALRTALR